MREGKKTCSSNRPPTGNKMLSVSLFLFSIVMSQVEEPLFSLSLSFFLFFFFFFFFFFFSFQLTYIRSHTYTRQVMNGDEEKVKSWLYPIFNGLQVLLFLGCILASYFLQDNDMSGGNWVRTHARTHGEGAVVLFVGGSVGVWCWCWCR